VPRFRKDVLKPGKYSVLTPDGSGRRTVEYTADDCVHLSQRYAEMAAAGLHVPLAWEHQDEAKPASERLADKARLILGWADGAEVGADKTLGFTLDVPDDDDGKRASIARYVSPEIVTDWQDGSGRVWPGKSITHIAITGKPVQMNQKPFQRLSLNTVRLSLEDLEKPKKEEEKAPEGDETPPDDATEDKGIGKPPDVGGVGKYSVQDAMQGLQALGLHLPPGTDEANLVQHICVACHALANSPEDDVETPPAAETPPEVTQQPKPAPGNPVMMSLEHKRDKERADRAEAELVKLHRDDLGRRIKRLRDTGRITKPLADKLSGELKTDRLSLADTGKLAGTPLVHKVEAYEALDEGASTAVHLSHEPKEIPNEAESGSTLNPDVMKRISGGRWNGAAKN